MVINNAGFLPKLCSVCTSNKNPNHHTASFCQFVTQTDAQSPLVALKFSALPFKLLLLVYFRHGSRSLTCAYLQSIMEE